MSSVLHPSGRGSRLLATVVLASIASSCASSSAAEAAQARALADREARCRGERVADAARWFLRHGQKRGRRDCSGLVEAILARAGLEARGGTSGLWLAAARGGRLAVDPWPGDLAFFDGTYDANANGKTDDELTHVAVVTGVACDGTVTMVHRAGGGPIELLRMNLHDPWDRARNDPLRARDYGAGIGLSGELFRIFARPPNNGG